MFCKQDFGTLICKMWQTLVQEKEKVAGFLIFLDPSQFFLIMETILQYNDCLLYEYKIYAVLSQK